MTRFSHTDPTQPVPLSELFTQNLTRQVTAHALGLAPADTSGEVEPHDAVPIQPVDPQVAWNDALAVLEFGGWPGSHPPGCSSAQSLEVAPGWSMLVNQHEPAFALAFSLGNFPQLVRDLNPLLTEKDRQALRLRQGNGGAPLVPAELETWARKQHEVPSRLLAAGILRLGHHHNLAAELLNKEVPAEWQALQANEQAALAWHQGEAEPAWEKWNNLQPSTPVLFNRGMASLFLGKMDAVRAPLTQAVQALPETSPWHHLGQLYLALV